jgi:hypothetical protein
MTKSPALIRVTVSPADIASPQMTLDELARRTEIALMAEYRDTVIDVKQSNNADQLVGVYAYRNDELVDVTNKPVATRIRSIVLDVWQRYFDEARKIEIEVAVLQAGMARLLTLPFGHPDRRVAHALFEAQLGLEAGASPLPSSVEKEKD